MPKPGAEGDRRGEIEVSDPMASSKKNRGVRRCIIARDIVNGGETRQNFKTTGNIKN